MLQPDDLPAGILAAKHEQQPRQDEDGDDAQPNVQALFLLRRIGRVDVPQHNHRQHSQEEPQALAHAAGVGGKEARVDHDHPDEQERG